MVVAGHGDLVSYAPVEARSRMPPDATKAGTELSEKNGAKYSIAELEENNQCRIDLSWNYVQASYLELQ